MKRIVAWQLICALTVSFSGLLACFPPALTKPQQKTNKELVAEDLNLARSFRKDRVYSKARMSYQMAMKRDQDEQGTLTQEQKTEALNGACLMLVEEENYEEAQRDCQSAVDAGAVDSSAMNYTYDGLRQQYGKWIDEHLTAGNSSGVKEKIVAYKSLPGAKPEHIASWEKRLASVERVELQRKQQEEQERRQAAEETKRKRQAQVKQARQRLEEKYVIVRMFNAQEFRWWLMSQQTVLGAQFFSDIDIDKSVLSLWVSDPDRLGNVSNLSMFADIADAFVVWCKCDGITQVGIDMQYIGGGKQVAYRYRFNPETGRSYLSR